MQPSAKQGLHPLLTAAAVSVTVFSAVGIGAFTGLLPNSIGSSREPAPVELSAPQAPAPASLYAAPASEIKDMPPAVPSATPAPAKKVVKKVAARAPAPMPSTPIVQAQAPVETPKPVPAGILGVVESVREVSTPATESNGVGPIAGGIAGAVVGNQFGKGMGRNVATVLGAAVGAFGGREIEQRVRATKHWEVQVRLDDGSSRTINSEAQPYWQGGERVRLVDGRLTPA